MATSFEEKGVFDEARRLGNTERKIALETRLGTPIILEQLKSEDFQGRVGFVATASALRRLLKKTLEVNAVKRALDTGELTECSIREFANVLMNNLQAGVPLEHDLAISALAVALEDRPTEFAEEYLRDLGELQAVEMSMSIRVARECLKYRVENNKSVLAKCPVPTVPPALELPSDNTLDSQR